MSSAHPESASVAVVTYRRPTHVRTCLQHLMAQTLAPSEIIVVDASEDDSTRKVVDEFPGVTYLRNEHGPGTTATSRATALEASSGEVLAFLDDDAYARPDWLERLLGPYADPSVAAVGGRALNGQPGEEAEGVGQVGLLLPDGSLTGFFAADTGSVVDVDHMLGANMSVRRSVALQVGGIHDHYPGTCVREETDLALRMRRAGLRIVYAPDAVVEHVAGPYHRGRRFDLRYTYFAQRNHLVLLARTLGVGSPYFRRYLRTAGRDIRHDAAHAARAIAGRSVAMPRGRVRAVGGGLARAAVKALGCVSGMVEVTRLRVAAGPVVPVRAELARG